MAAAAPPRYTAVSKQSVADEQEDESPDAAVGTGRRLEVSVNCVVSNHFFLAPGEEGPTIQWREDYLIFSPSVPTSYACY